MPRLTLFWKLMEGKMKSTWKSSNNQWKSKLRAHKMIWRTFRLFKGSNQWLKISNTDWLRMPTTSSTRRSLSKMNKTKMNRSMLKIRWRSFRITIWGRTKILTLLSNRKEQDSYMFINQMVLKCIRLRKLYRGNLKRNRYAGRTK